MTMSRSLTPSQTRPQPTPENEGGGEEKADSTDSGQLEPGKIINAPLSHYCLLVAKLKINIHQNNILNSNHNKMMARKVVIQHE